MLIIKRFVSDMYMAQELLLIVCDGGESQLTIFHAPGLS
jgi:hypothetical protein